MSAKLVRRGARHMTAKTRETETEALKARWEARAKKPRSATLTAVRLDLAAEQLGIPIDRNAPTPEHPFPSMLLLFFELTGRTEFLDAFTVLDDMGIAMLGGAEFDAALRALTTAQGMQTLSDVAFHRGLLAYVDQQRDAGVSEQAAVERFATDYSIEATSFAGAVQWVKRALREARKTGKSSTVKLGGSEGG
jgi:hypothetical protein